MKKKVIIIIVLLVCALFVSGITYSKFNVDTNLITEDTHIASFIFEGEKKDNIDILIDSFKPGDKKDYLFSISNNSDDKNSDVTIEYQIIVKTYHFLPLDINLYKDNNIILSCDETYSRNDKNELVCNSDIFEMKYNEKSDNEFKLNVSFNEEYNSSLYSNLTDFIDIEIKSWQK